MHQKWFERVLEINGVEIPMAVIQVALLAIIVIGLAYYANVIGNYDSREFIRLVSSMAPVRIAGTNQILHCIQEANNDGDLRWNCGGLYDEN